MLGARVARAHAERCWKRVHATPGGQARRVQHVAELSRAFFLVDRSSFFDEDDGRIKCLSLHVCTASSEALSTQRHAAPASPPYLANASRDFFRRRRTESSVPLPSAETRRHAGGEGASRWRFELPRSLVVDPPRPLYSLAPLRVEGLTQLLVFSGAPLGFHCAHASCPYLSTDGCTAL